MKSKTDMEKGGRTMVVHEYKVVEHPERVQRYTIWQGNQVIYFATTMREVESYVNRPRHAR